MARPAGRIGWFAVGLLGAAAALLALSFAPWGAAATPAAAGISPSVAPTPTVALAPTDTPAEVGRTLFTLKGCATCHRHDGLQAERLTTRGGEAVPVSRSLVGATGAPDLTHYDPDPDFLRGWLKDPRAFRPDTQMPDLGLRRDEIEALLAFLEE